MSKALICTITNLILLGLTIVLFVGKPRKSVLRLVPSVGSSRKLESPEEQGFGKFRRSVLPLVPSFGDSRRSESLEGQGFGA